MLSRMSFTITMSIFWAGWICCVMFGCYNQSEALPVESEIQLLQVGAFHGDEVSAESGEIWLGLYSTPDGYALIPSTITVETVYDPFVDNAGEKTGKVVSAEGQTRPLFLIKGLNASERESIKTLSTEQTVLSPGKSLNLGFSDENESHLTVYGEGEVGPNGFTSLENYSLELSNGQVSQELLAYSSTDGAIPSLLWAGDLDGDNRLDLVINATPHYVVSSAPMLFLSSMAKGGNLVQRVAIFIATGC
ncbi:hypothetical protein C6502_14545 [Candidatus Poribacteria bacterium]|nr:MAG: hypothetical protein C6502_14545 [Candidatus Poribacteria bacterium]